MTCEPIDIIDFTPGTGNYEFKYVDECFSFRFYDVIINFLSNRTNILI